MLLLQGAAIEHGLALSASYISEGRFPAPAIPPSTLQTLQTTALLSRPVSSCLARQRKEITTLPGASIKSSSRWT